MPNEDEKLHKSRSKQAKRHRHRKRARERSRSRSRSRTARNREERARARNREERARDGSRSTHRTRRTPPRKARSRSRNSRGRSRSGRSEVSESVSHLGEAIIQGMGTLASKLQVRDSNELVSVTSIASNIIEEFNPARQNVKDWLETIDEYASIYKWSDKITCHLALSKLKGAAEVWYRGLPTRIHSWQEWKDLLLKNFVPKRNLHKLLSAMMACVAKPNQSLYEYTFQKLALINRLKIPLSNEDQVNLIMGGIADKQIQFSVETADIKEPSRLASHFKVYDAARAAQPEIGPGGVSGTMAGAGVVASASSAGAGGSHKQATAGQNHLNPKRCYRCNQVGHLKLACPNKNLPRRKAIEYNVNIIGRPTNQKFYKHVDLNNSKVKCYLDLGSEVSLITQSAASKLSLHLKSVSSPIILSTLTGEIFPQLYTNAKLKVDNVERNIDFYIIEREVMGVDLLVGQNFTELNDVFYCKVNDDLSFSEMPQYTSVNALKRTDVNIGVDNQEVIDTLLKLLDEYSACTAQNLSEIGVTSLAEMTIKLVSDRPIAHRPRRFSDLERVEIRDLVNELLVNGIIRESKSPYASTVLLVKKKNCEKKRLCVDYRALNKITVPEVYPFPLIEDHLRRLSGCKYFVVLDLFSSYYHIPVAPESIPLTAFVTQDGQYEFLRVPFGLVNAPVVFQRMLNAALGQLRFTRVLVYLDDILIPTQTIEEGLEILREVLEIFKTHGLTLNLKKCNFLATTIEYLGYEICESQIKPTQTKLQAVANYVQPTNIHEVRQYLGLTGYFRKFIHNYALKSKPLSALLHKNAVWEWGPAQESAFQELKRNLLDQPVLALFDPGLEILLYTDASQWGLAGILMQVHDEGERVVSYFSRQTTQMEQKFHSFELETLAIVSAVKRFREYLLGRNFIIVTDCNAVKSTFEKHDLNPRIGRWVLALSEYQYKIVHRSGKQMQHVDALSRHPLCEEKGMHAMVISEDTWLLAAQQQDKEIRGIKTVLETGNMSENKDIFQNYFLKGGKVYKITPQGMRWVVPQFAKFQLLRMSHDESGHFSFEKTYELISNQYWFKGMRRFIKKYVKNCLNCLYFKNPQGQLPGYLHPIPKYPVPFHTIHVDHLGPFIKTKSGNTQLLVIVDAFTKFILIYAVKSTKTKFTIRALKDMIKVFGVPRRIISDRGKSFTSTKFQQFCQNIGTKHYLNAVAVPRANGQVERYNRTILNSLATMGANYDDDCWDENIANIQLGLNGTLNKAIGVSPSEALFGFRVFSQGQLELEREAVDVTAIRANIEERQDKYQSDQKRRFDLKRSRAHPYAQGDLVLIRITTAAASGTSRKLLPKWRGPFRVTKVLGNDRYEVADIPGNTRSRLRYSGIAAVDNMRPWIHFDEGNEEATSQ